MTKAYTEKESIIRKTQDLIIGPRRAGNVKVYNPLNIAFTNQHSS